MSFAHVKWFVEDTSNKIPSITSKEAMYITLFVLVGLLLAYIVDKQLKANKPIAKISDQLQPLRDWMPTIVRAILALILTMTSINHTIFAPNLVADSDLAVYLLISTSILSVMFILGLATRVAAFALLITCVAAAFNFGSLNLVEHAELVGLSLFLIIEGPGRLAFDNILMKVRTFPNKYRRHSMRIVLVSAGISFATLAFTEKLADLTLALSFLNDHNWNFLGSLGVSDRYFMLFIGASELTIGLTLILGLASRLVVLLLLVLLSVTAALLGINEVVGHAFAVAVVAAAWINHDLPNMRTKHI